MGCQNQKQAEEFEEAFEDFSLARLVPTHTATEPPTCRIGWVSSKDLRRRYDLVIIGGGPAGVAGALKSACSGRRTLIVDKPKLQSAQSKLDISFAGPTGLFSKALRDSGMAIDVNLLRSLCLDETTIWQQIRSSSECTAAANAEQQLKLLRDLNVDYLQAQATIKNAQEVLVLKGNGDRQSVSTDSILVATGSKPSCQKEIPFDGQRIYNEDTINMLNFLPKHVVIMGSGVTAIEYAKIFRLFGAEVLMVMRGSKISSLKRIGLDRDISAKLLETLEFDHVRVYEHTTISEYHVPPCFNKPLQLHLKSLKTGVPIDIVTCDLLLAAVGRSPNVQGLGLRELGVEFDSVKGHILVDEKFETNVMGIYAAGDVIGPPALATTGISQAQRAVHAIFGMEQLKNSCACPVGLWTIPECAYYGETKEAAEEKGLKVEETTADYSSCLRGCAFNPYGILKLVFRVDTGVIIGVHIIGADACELVHYGMGLVLQGVTIPSVLTQLFEANTYHNLYREAAIKANPRLANAQELRGSQCKPKRRQF